MGLSYISSHFDTKPLYDKATEDIKKWENYFFIKIILRIQKHLVTWKKFFGPLIIIFSGMFEVITILKIKIKIKAKKNYFFDTYFSE